MAKKAAGRRAKAARAPSVSKRGARRASQAAGSNEEKSGYRQKVQERKLEAANKKPGCVPKLFMLLLPFAAVGAYLLLRS